MTAAADDDAGADIAIIGMACRFPGAPSVQAFWRNLCDSSEAISVAPRTGATNDEVRAGALLEGIEEFDAKFFGFSRREAELLDPQHRAFLECAWEALEDGGYESSAFRGVIGAFGGTGPSSYLFNNVHPSTTDGLPRTFLTSTPELQILLATDKDFMVGRASYKLDLRGPSVNVQAACATSLVAVHLACQSLLAGECDLALAGAASIPVPQINAYRFEPGMAMSPDGRCRPYDQHAAGTVFGSGAGVVLLRTMEDALAHGDSVHAVIRGSAINNDGGRRAGITTPTVDGQARAIEEALRVAGVEPATIGFVEGHGTATPLGDPIEIAALIRAFRATRKGECVLGSVKGNIGHLGWASGIAGLIKAACCVRDGIIPATLHFTAPNPRSELSGSPFFVNAERIAWRPERGPRRAGVSAFGLGGANAHVVLEQAPTARGPRGQPSVCGDEDGRAERPFQILTVSARSEKALSDLVQRYRDHLTSSLFDFVDIAFTSNVGRRHFEVRHAVVAANTVEANGALARFAREDVQRSAAGEPRVVAVFPGQGAEYVGMARQLYTTEPAFRRAIDAFEQVGSELLDAAPSVLLYKSARDRDRIARIDLAQPLMFTVQVALAELWRSWGVKPAIVVGHSLGEFAAACTAGIVDPVDVFRLVVQRGRLIARLPADGAMAAVSASEDVVRATLARTGQRVAIAAINSPSNTVVSGLRRDVDSLMREFAADGIAARDLGVDRAGHSPWLDEILDEFEAAGCGVEYRAAHTEMVSTLAPSLGVPPPIDGSYWRRQLRGTVQFAAAIAAILTQEAPLAFVEMSPAPVLLGAVGEVLANRKALLLPSLRPSRGDCEQMLQSLGTLYAHGYPVDWEQFHARRPRRRVNLPTYPFQRQRYWLDAPAMGAPRVNARASTSWETMLYEPRWVASPSELSVPDGERRQAGAGWLVLSDRGGVGTRLRAALDDAGHQCELFHSSDGPSDQTGLPTEDVSAIRRVLSDAGRLWRGVIDLRALDAPSLDATSSPCASASAAIRIGCAGTLHLLQVLAATPRPPPCWIVTRGAECVPETPSVAVQLAQAPIAGLCRVAAIEHPDVRAIRVDLDPDGADDVEALMLELRMDLREQQIALRRGVRYVARLDRRNVDVRPVALIRADATYLIVGGTRGLGLLTAERLVGRGGRHMVLVGRNAPDDAGLARIQALRRKGAKIAVLSADVADAQRVRELIDGIDASGPTLAGVVHAAAVLDDGVMREMTWCRFHRVLLPKADGAWNLYAALMRRSAPLDFFILYSSATSLVGNAGQANYAAASAFLDALAYHARSTGVPALTINWGAWTSDGRLASQPEIVARLVRIGMGALGAADGLAALDVLVGADATQIGVLPIDWATFLREHQLESIPFFERVQERAQSEPPHGKVVADRILTANPEGRRAILRETVRAHVARLLDLSDAPGEEPLDDDRRLGEYGMDSLSATQLRNVLQSTLACALSPTACFQHPTIRQLAEHLDTQILDADWAARARAARPLTPVPIRPASASRMHERRTRAISMQQSRWMMLTRLGYGRLVVPIRFDTRLDQGAFAHALRALVERHEVLRWRFDGERAHVLAPGDAVAPSSQLFRDIRTITGAERQACLIEEARVARENMPDPTRGVSWSMRCLGLADDRFLALLSAQHLEVDGAAISVFVDDIRELYRHALGGPPASAPRARTYVEFIDWQQEYTSTRMLGDRAFFSGLYTACRGPTLLPGDPDLHVTRAFPSRRHTLSPRRPLWRRLRAAATKAQVSPFAILCASYCRILGEILGTPDVTVGTIVAGRPIDDFARTIGPFVAPFPLFVQNVKRPVLELAEDCNRIVSAINARCAYPPADLASTVPPFAGLPKDTYFTDAFIMFNNYQRESTDADLKVEVLECLAPMADPELSGLDASTLLEIAGLFLIVDAANEELRFNWWYHEHRFDESRVAAWATRHLSELMAAIGSDDA